MNKHLRLAASALLCAAGLTACGDAGDEGGANGTGAEAPAATGAMPADWKATDACTIVDKAEVAAALKQEVKETQLSLVHEPGTADAGTSECAYIGTDDSRIASVAARWSPINDNTAASIDGTRNAAAAAIKAFSDTPIEDVPGLGKAAFFSPAIDSLTVFVDDARMVTVTVNKVPDGASGKDVAVALAKAAGA